MIDMNWEKTWVEENPTQLYTSGGGSWKQSPRPVQLYIDLVRPVHPLQYVHMCKES